MDVQYNKKAADVKVDGKIDSTDSVLLDKILCKNGRCSWSEIITFYK